MGVNVLLKLLLLLLPLAAAATESGFAGRINFDDIQLNQKEPFSSTISNGWLPLARKRYAAGCEYGRSYWNAAGQRCVACSLCGSEEIIVRPCGLDRDVVCGPLSDLHSDYWAWLQNRFIKNAEERKERTLDNAGIAVPLRTKEMSELADWKWDWEAGVLLMAIIVCALFFAVVAGYSLHHARHWRILEEHYEADAPSPTSTVEADKDSRKALVDANRRITIHEIPLSKNLSNLTIHHYQKLLLLLLPLAAAATESGFAGRINFDDIQLNQEEPFSSTISNGWLPLARKRYAAGCEYGRSYWNAAGQRCVACSLCGSEEIIVRPCGLDRDVVCGPLSDLHSDYWAWLQNRFIKNAEERKERILDNAGIAVPLRTKEMSELADWKWDWEAGVLLMAIIVCALFFAVVAGYSLHHARHWRILEEHYEADVEEISTRLALISAASASLSDCTHPNNIVSTTPDSNQDGNCSNLEQLLAGKSTSRHPGRVNIYIEDNEA
ncbi:tumor necrosis factor receptor superfamily member wengen [Ctenocephalides felis]|uniref:tumor necrosis factor receptor superfamily member wengen n=1 Tax=Ctenocephalides felis TaxID=7515 RepID=UPI000E6E12D5|nr:tumor necrosis factor receptor superfamily member wengen [Ctenocephalides felis]